jgi:hypothetical protein
MAFRQGDWMKRSIWLTMLVLTVGSFVASAQRQPATMTIDVHKSPTWGCCGAWVRHLQENGFTVRTIDTEKLDELKASHRIPRQAQSCHTALVAGYVIEGHVPAADVKRLLKERPAIAGIAVPGMPIGSPGMEVAGMKPQPFDVVAFGKDGSTRVFATHGR